ncbi:MAG: hypothetical protein AAF696_21285 [Bacteroidota bacterium]
MSKPEENPDEELRKVLPFFKTWRSLYIFVIGELIVLIILFYFFSNYYA